MYQSKMIIRIKDSYKVWDITKMIHTLDEELAPKLLNRSYKSLIIEWYLHNIAYYITLPFISIKWVKSINERAKHVDLDEVTK